MLGSLIRDIFNNRLDTPAELQDAFDMANNGLQRPTVETMTEMLKAAIQDFGAVYIVVDAVDECPRYDGERAKLLRLLQEIFCWRAPNLHIFVTSRRELDILEAFEQTPRNLGQLQIIDAQGKSFEKDIEIFLTQRFGDAKFSTWNWTLREEVKHKLVSRAQGMSVTTSLL